MDFETLVQTRRSVRGFKKQPVPRAVIEEIIEVAKRAPSSMNTQPWHIHVLTGEPLEQVRRRNMEEMMAGAKPKRDIVSHGEYQGVHRGRQVDIAKKLFAVMGIARDDKPMRQDWVLRGFRQFDAPVSLVLAYDRVLDPGAVCHFDLGALCYGIVLAAWDRGLGSRHQRAGHHPLRHRARGRRRFPEDQVIMTCVAMGYPDDSFPANARPLRPLAQWRFRPLCRLQRLTRSERSNPACAKRLDIAGLKLGQALPDGLCRPVPPRDLRRAARRSCD